MPPYEKDIAHLHEMLGNIRAIRDRTCVPKSPRNPRYQALSLAVSGLKKAAEDMRQESALSPG
ncbi:MAG: hypothetical protein ACXV3F_07530 [Frankiaceae bacterium]